MCVYMQIVVCIDDGWKLVPGIRESIEASDHRCAASVRASRTSRDLVLLLYTVSWRTHIFARILEKDRKACSRHFRRYFRPSSSRMNWMPRVLKLSCTTAPSASFNPASPLSAQPLAIFGRHQATCACRSCPPPPLHLSPSQTCS